MHNITGALVILVVLHLAGFLIPLLVAAGVGLVVGIVYLVVKPFISSVPEHRVVVDYSAHPISSEREVPTPYRSETTEQSLTMKIRQRDSTSSQSNVLPTSGLIIKMEPLAKILNGHKTWEMRSITTNKRGSIALIGKGTKEILGVAEIVDVVGPLSRKEMAASEQLHQISADRLASPEVAQLKYAWVLSNVRRFRVPVAYSPRNGAVRFVNLSSDETDAIRAQL